MKHAKNRTSLLPTVVALATLAACGGPSNVGSLGANGRTELVSVEVGRLVDVYSYQRIDPSVGDRRIRSNRRLELVARNLVVNPNIESQSLFDLAGNVVTSANFEYLPFDKSVGHEQLLILWDSANPEESQNFQAAFASAQGGLTQLPPSYRGQNTANRPIPIVPRNAALRLRFNDKITADSAFFLANPQAVQLLEFKGDPTVVSPVDAFRILPSRVIPNGDSIIIDTTILAGESDGVGVSTGLPVSVDSVTANIRIAMPVRGAVSRDFFVREDSIQELNGIDSSGEVSIIRDFRSGNLSDGVAGRLREPEAPMIVGSLSMGIVNVDPATNVVTINKRNSFVPVRGRYPFVDGPLTAGATIADRIPLGPLSVPTVRPLRHGDFLTQNVIVSVDGVLETVSLRAEILENLSVNSVAGSSDIGRPLANPADPEQGRLSAQVSVRVANVFAGRDSKGNPVRFQATAFGESVVQPQGQDCTLRALYYESVPFSDGGGVVSDATYKELFLRIDPKPVQAAVDIAPNSSVAIEFTKPMDLDQVDNSKNLLITSRGVSQGANPESFAEQMTDPKRAKARLVATRLTDQAGDGTVLRLQPPIGFFHTQGTGEYYSIHVRSGASGVTDLAGNQLQLFDDPSNPTGSWSVDFRLAVNAATNQVGWFNLLFEAEDEDGTMPGSIDIFGQYRMENGRLIAASGLRTSRSADSQNLSGISRIGRGECWDEITNLQGIPNANTAPVDANGAPHPGLLYWEPRMISTIAPPNVPNVYEYNNILSQPVGRVIEPLKPQGARMQMRYLEDDFSLSYTAPNDFALDVEQLYWSPFSDEPVLYDVFDRFTMSLAHSKRRPDVRFVVIPGQIIPPVPPATQPTIIPPGCLFVCASVSSGLSELFSDNVLEGTTAVPVFQDKLYAINPNSAFRTVDNVKYVPFPRFDRSYTWRDSRLVTVDAGGAVIGLGGALQPNALENDDNTADVDSPWITSNIPQPFLENGGSVWVNDTGDFRGTAQRDHDPIALPLLVDFKVFADGAANGVAGGLNGFQVAMLGSPPTGFPNQGGSAGGYFDALGAGCGTRPPWPATRSYAAGGFDPQVPGAQIFIDPANQLQAQPSSAKDAGMGAQANALFTAPSRDGMLNWARADFVRKVSTMTFGFFDTLQPQRNETSNGAGGIIEDSGFPNLFALNPNLRVTDLLIQLDPPQARQPAGTTVVAELRGVETIGDPPAAEEQLYDPSISDDFAARGQLLNPNYACEAYRYSTANQADGTPRVPTTGLTRYVTEDQLNQLRDSSTNLLPRYLNLRLTMTNNVTVTPPLSPSLRSLSIVYRVAAP